MRHRLVMAATLALLAVQARAQPSPGPASPALAPPAAMPGGGKPGGMAGMSMGGTPSANEAPSTRAFRESMAKMDRGMNVPYTGNTDRDFVAGMIPHHEGAVDMARVELRYGKDPALRKLARTIIASQQKEIAFMQKWQAQHGR
jgi:uncharacterized protein (DUF305 family)